MKTLIAAAVVALIANVASAQTYTAPAAPRKAPPPPRHEAPQPITSRDVQGVIPRAARGGNPLQMLNPGAPARYGTAEEHVMLKPDGSGKWNGIRLFAIYF